MADDKEEVAELDIDAAVFNALLNIGALEKTGHNNHFDTSYSTIDDILNASRPSFRDQKLIFGQVLKYNDDQTKAQLITFARNINKETHEFGCGPWFTPSDNSQQFGSQLTYMRRQCYLLAFNLGGEDDDGNSAPTGSPDELVAIAQQEEIKKLVVDAGMDVDKWKIYMTKTGMADPEGQIYSSKYEAAKEATQNTIDAKASS